MFSSRNIEHDKALAARLGGGARAGTPRDAAAFGEVVMVSVPYGSLPDVGKTLGDLIRGKVVIDTCNPFPWRDGEIAEWARKKGAGLASAELLPGARLVRAFNSLPSWELKSEAHRAGEKAAIPLAADDAQALKVAERLVRDAGFEPVVVGGLSRAREFDVGTAVYGRAHTARELREALGLENP